MIKRFCLLLLLVTLSKLSFSQLGLKRVSDTTWEIGIKQIQAANTMYVRYQQCDSINVYLLRLLDSSSSMYDYCISSLNSLYGVIAVKDSTIADSRMLLNKVLIDNKKLLVQNKRLKRGLLIATLVATISTFILLR